MKTFKIKFPNIETTCVLNEGEMMAAMGGRAGDCKFICKHSCADGCKSGNKNSDCPPCPEIQELQ